MVQTNYDIVKAHGGEIKVKSLSAAATAQAGKEGEARPPARLDHSRPTGSSGRAGPDDPVGRGTTFIIVLPS